MFPQCPLNLIAVILLLALLLGPAARPVSAEPAQVLVTFTVNSTSDLSDINPGDGICRAFSLSGFKCTLRAAIQESNSLPGGNAVKFNLSGTAPFKLALNSPLPLIGGRILLKADSQPNCTHPCVVLDGAALPAGSIGFTILGDNSLMRGFVIRNFKDAGIRLFGDGNQVQGNHLFGNNLGISIRGSENLIGGTLAAQRNVISGNALAGIRLYNDMIPAQSNVIQGNYIGTDPTGTMALPHQGNGIIIADNASYTQVGGEAAGARNVISGNLGNGIYLDAAGATLAEHTTIQGNFIGTKASGTAALPNGVAGIVIGFDARHTLVGGATSAARNIISGNQSAGIQVAGFDSIIQGNFIGLDPTGALAVPNQGAGISIQGSAADNLVNNNRIAHNLQDGIAATSTGPNAFRSNSLFGNHQLAIDLGNDGVTLNDVEDPDSGPNGRQNFPTLVWARSGTQVIKAVLLSQPGSVYIVSFYSSPAGKCDPMGYGEGKKFLGNKQVVTDGDGFVQFNFTSPRLFNAGAVITALAIDDFGNTSEFSRCVVAG